MGRLTEVGPAGLVPLAWAFVGVADLTEVVAMRTVLIALLVMDAIFVAFLASSWEELRPPGLLAWRRVLLVGLAATLAGTIGLLADVARTPLLALALYAWLLLPVWGYVRTWQATARNTVYLVAAVLSAAGAGTHLAWSVLGAPAGG
jgi:hypothetical protein